MYLALILLIGVLGGESAKAQMVEVKDSPSKSARPSETSKDRARGYFRERQPEAKTEEKSTFSKEVQSDSGGTPRYLAVRLGGFFQDQAYRWKRASQSDVGGFNGGVDYRLGEWINSADLALRADYTSYSLSEGSARKLSFGGIVTFPDANSRFPLYFGAGLGLGVFVKQLHNESALALDYSLLGGVRFFNVFNRIGLLAEVGIKNHLLMFSDGQFNGIYINVGAVFAF